MRVLVVCEGEHEQSGALQNLLIKLGGGQAEFTAEDVSNIRVAQGIGSHFKKKAIACLRLATINQYDALVFLVDQDNDKKRIKQIQQAQEHQEEPLPRAMGVAIKTFDAWMLADEQALTKVLGYTIPTQPDPETENNPKQKCKELRDNSNKTIAQREMYAEIANQINIEILSARCPKGFKPFAENAKNIFT